MTVFNFFLGTATCPDLTVNSPVTKSEFCMTLTSVSDIDCHHRDLVSHIKTPILHQRKIMLCISLTNGQVLYYELLQRVKPTLRTCSSWSVYKKHWSKRWQHCLIARRYSSSMTMPGLMWHRWPGIPYGDTVPSTLPGTCTSRLPSLSFPGQQPS